MLKPYSSKDERRDENMQDFIWMMKYRGKKYEIEEEVLRVSDLIRNANSVNLRRLLFSMPSYYLDGTKSKIDKYISENNNVGDYEGFLLL